jgi:hypothetical protein
MNIKGYELFVYLKLQVPLSPTSLICGWQLRNLRFCMPQDSWQTLLTFAAAGLMAFTGSSFSVAAGAPVLTEVLVFLDHALCLCDQQSLMKLCIIAR